MGKGYLGMLSGCFLRWVGLTKGKVGEKEKGFVTKGSGICWEMYLGFCVIEGMNVFIIFFCMSWTQGFWLFYHCHVGPRMCSQKIMFFYFQLSLTATSLKRRVSAPLLKRNNNNIYFNLAIKKCFYSQCRLSFFID